MQHKLSHTPLGITRHENPQRMAEVFQNISTLVSRAEAEILVEKTIEEVVQVCHEHEVGQAWSGGKDSLVLDFILREALGNCPSLLVLADRSLEWTEMQPYWKAHAPHLLEVKRMSHLTLKWYGEHPEHIFSNKADINEYWLPPKWKIQHTWIKNLELTMLLTGRRLRDGNMCREGSYQVKQGHFVYNPLRDWSHEDLFAVIHYYQLPLAPTYFYPGGFHLNAQTWADIEVGNTEKENWEYLARYDQEVLKAASQYFPLAREVYTQTGYAPQVDD